MEHVQQQLDVSQRRACQVLGQPRTTQRYPSQRVAKDQVLTEAIFEKAYAHKRWGYRKITALLRADGWHINFKRVYRIWRQEGLQVPYKQHKQRRLGCSENGCIRHQPEHYNHIWSIDFIMDQTSDGGRLKILPVIDEYTRDEIQNHPGSRNRHLVSSVQNPASSIQYSARDLFVFLHQSWMMA